MMTTPKIEPREERHYLAIRTPVTLKEMGSVIPKLHSEVFALLKKKNIPPSGAPFIRFLVIDMERELEIELGVPVAKAESGAGRIQAGILPAGRYATLIYTGVRNGIPANAALLEWAKKEGITFQTRETAKGEAWEGRVESFLTDPDTEPDMDKWQTEVAFLVKEDPADKEHANVPK